jgi:uncharacterized protein (TIGR03437 family)
MKRYVGFLFVILAWGLLIQATQAQHVSVNAADYTRRLAPGTIVAAFGTNLSTSMAVATTIPLPKELGGTRVTVSGQQAALFFVSPLQVNYQIPPTVSPGTAEVVITRADGISSRETIQILNSAPAIFTLNQSGSGTGAILDGRTFKLGPFNGWTESGEPTILALFGTGLGDASRSSGVSPRLRVLVEGIEARLHYAGPHPVFVGLDQINFELPLPVESQSPWSVVVKVDNQASNTATIDVLMPQLNQMSLAFSHVPIEGIDALEVTIKSIILTTDKGVEVVVLSTPVELNLLAPNPLADLLKATRIPPGTYVSVTVEYSNLKASFNGQMVRIEPTEGKVTRQFPQPITIPKEKPGGLKLHIDLRESIRPQPDGSYLFTPVIQVILIGAGEHHGLNVFSGKIQSLDAVTGMLEVIKDGGKGGVVKVDASQAVIFGPHGEILAFSALKAGDSVMVIGWLNHEGKVVATAIRLVGADYLPPQGLAVTGTILEIDRSVNTFITRVEHWLLKRGPFPFGPPSRLRVVWDEQTKFFKDGDGPATPDDLKVGAQVYVLFEQVENKYLAKIVRILGDSVEGVITDTSGLPNSFKMVAHEFKSHGIWSSFDDSTASHPTRIITVELDGDTKIITVFGVKLTPEDLRIGDVVSVTGSFTDTGRTTIKANLIIVAPIPSHISVEGTVKPDDVNALLMFFKLTKLTPDNSNSKVGVLVTPQTQILDKEGNQISKNDFFDHLKAATRRLRVEGRQVPPTPVLIFGTPTVILASKINLKD